MEVVVESTGASAHHIEMARGERMDANRMPTRLDHVVEVRKHVNGTSARTAGRGDLFRVAKIPYPTLLYLFCVSVYFGDVQVTYVPQNVRYFTCKQRHQSSDAGRERPPTAVKQFPEPEVNDEHR